MAARARTVARGYGEAHRRLRAQLERFVASGRARCARCREPILPDEPWDLGHDDHDRRVYVGPEHQRCNRATSAHRARPERHSRVW